MLSKQGFQGNSQTTLLTQNENIMSKTIEEIESSQTGLLGRQNAESLEASTTKEEIPEKLGD
ncbi:hypothetical protein MKW92_007470, partial [Papaver armeniacum]